jgi:hypothetical protein
MEREKNMEQKTFEQVLKENMDLWFKLLKEKNIEAMVELYAERCSFLPTFSDKIITDKQGVREYFEHFMSMSPEGKLVSEDTGEELAEGVYSSSAFYDFDTPNGVVNARFDMTWVKKDGKWVIKVHHSSVVPKTQSH